MLFQRCLTWQIPCLIFLFSGTDLLLLICMNLNHLPIGSHFLLFYICLCNPELCYFICLLYDWRFDFYLQRLHWPFGCALSAITLAIYLVVIKWFEVCINRNPVSLFHFPFSCHPASNSFSISWLASRLDVFQPLTYSVIKSAETPCCDNFSLRHLFLNTELILPSVFMRHS